MDKKDREKEFEDALSQYNGIITKICYYFSSDSEEFKDLRQEVLYNIWKGLEKFRHDAKFSTWIYRVCFNTCVSIHRKEKNIKKISIDNILNIPIDNDIPKLQQYNEMHALIQKLKYTDRILILMWLDELSYEEISSLTGINRNTIAIRLKRIKEKLIEMNKQGDNYGRYK